jgi:hypothetical protein
MYQEIRNQNQEILKKLNLHVLPSRLPTPFMHEEPMNPDDRDSSSMQSIHSTYQDTTPTGFNQLYHELGGFSNILRLEANAVTLQTGPTETTSDQGSSSSSSNPNDFDVTQLQKIQREIDSVLERALNQQKRMMNKSIRRNDTYDSAISGMSTIAPQSPTCSTFSDTRSNQHNSPQRSPLSSNFSMNANPSSHGQPTNPELILRLSTITSNASSTLPHSPPGFGNADKARASSAPISPRGEAQDGSAPELQPPPATQDWLVVCRNAEV